MFLHVSTLLESATISYGSCFLCLLTPLGWFCVAFWRQIDFEGVAKSNLLDENQHEMKEPVDGIVLIKHDVELIFHAIIGGFEMQKQAFHIIAVANARFRCFANRHRK